jgi:hypothetical protein
VLTDGLAQKRLQISGWLLGEDRDTPYDGSSETLNPLQERTKIRVWLVTTDVRIGTMWGIQVTAAIPDVTRTAVVVLPASTFMFSETFQGLGDTSVLAWRRRVSSTGWNMTLNGGVSVPTGKTAQPHFFTELQEDSLVPISRLQRGTGTIDPVFGVSANRVVMSILPPGIRVFVTGAARIPLPKTNGACVPAHPGNWVAAHRARSNCTRSSASSEPAGCTGSRTCSRERRCWWVVETG